MNLLQIYRTQNNMNVVSDCGIIYFFFKWGMREDLDNDSQNTLYTLCDQPSLQPYLKEQLCCICDAIKQYSIKPEVRNML